MMTSLAISQECRQSQEPRRTEQDQNAAVENMTAYESRVFRIPAAI